MNELDFDFVFLQIIFFFSHALYAAIVPGLREWSPFNRRRAQYFSIFFSFFFFFVVSFLFICFSIHIFRFLDSMKCYAHTRTRWKNELLCDVEFRTRDTYYDIYVYYAEGGAESERQTKENTKKIISIKCVKSRMNRGCIVLWYFHYFPSKYLCTPLHTLSAWLWCSCSRRCFSVGILWASTLYLDLFFSFFLSYSVSFIPQKY